MNSTGSGTSMRNPWGGYPGYTALQVENFYRAGEDATMLRAAYNFPRVTGLSVYGLLGAWFDAERRSIEYAQDEYDANVQWSARSGA